MACLGGTRDGTLCILHMGHSGGWASEWVAVLDGVLAMALNLLVLSAAAAA